MNSGLPVLTTDSGSVIADMDPGLWIQVNELKEMNTAENMAYCLAPLYWLKDFLPEKK